MAKTFPTLLLLIALTLGGPERRLETGHLLQLFGIPSPFDRDFCGGAIDLAEVVGRKFDCCRSNVLL
jgi:hypothetical protein